MKRLIWMLVALFCVVGVVSAQDLEIDLDEYQVITPDNIAQTRFIGYLGTGWNAGPVWLSDNKTVFVNTSTGQWRYDVTALDIPPTFAPYPPLYSVVDTFRTNLDGINLKEIAISPDRQYTVELIQEGLPDNFVSREHKVPLIVRQRETGEEVGRVMSDAIGGLRTYSGLLTLPTFGVLGLTYFRDDKLYRWSPETGHETLLIDQGLDVLVYSPDARYLATFTISPTDGASTQVRFWDLTGDQGKMIFEKDFPGPIVPFYSDSITVDFSPDGTSLIESQHSHNVRIWDVASQGMIYRDTNLEPETDAATHHVAYSLDGRYIAGCQITWDDYAFLRDVSSGEDVAIVDGLPSTQFCKDVLFHPNGTDLLIVTSYDTVEVWPIETLLARKTVTVEETPVVFGGSRERNSLRVLSASLNASGTTLGIAYSDGTIHLWDYATQRETMTLENDSPVFKLVLDPIHEGRFITGDANGSVILWDLNEVKRTVLATFDNEPRYLADRLFPLLMNDQGTLLLATDGAYHLYIWDMATWQLQTCSGTMPQAFSSDGRFMAAIESGGDVALYGVKK